MQLQLQLLLPCVAYCRLVQLQLQLLLPCTCRLPSSLRGRSDVAKQALDAAAPAAMLALATVRTQVVRGLHVHLELVLGGEEGATLSVHALHDAVDRDVRITKAHVV